MKDRRDPSPHNDLVRFWCEEYERNVGAKYPFNGGKDGKTIKWLREMYGDDELKGYMLAFFEIDDDFIQNSGFGLGVFRGCLPKVIQFVKRAPKTRDPWWWQLCEHAPKCDSFQECNALRAKIKAADTQGTLLPPRV